MLSFLSVFYFFGKISVLYFGGGQLYSNVFVYFYRSNRAALGIPYGVELSVLNGLDVLIL